MYYYLNVVQLNDREGGRGRCREKEKNVDTTTIPYAIPSTGTVTSKVEIISSPYSRDPDWNVFRLPFGQRFVPYTMHNNAHTVRREDIADLFDFNYVTRD